MRNTKNTKLNTPFTDKYHKAAAEPLFIIFEQHLFNLQDSDMDRKSFVERVLKDYLAFLAKHKITIPKSLFQMTMNELSSQIHQMLIKKVYGHLSIRDYQAKLPTKQKRSARAKYSRLTA